VTDDLRAEEQPAAEQPLPAGSPVAEQTAELNAQVATMLNALDGMPTAEHAQTYAALHGRLQGALGDLDGE
jgi:hypothetical protein